MCCSERALLAISLSSETDEILAHAAFLDYPNVAGVDKAEWVDWLKTFFDASGCSSLNTVFMHYFVSKPDYASGCAREVVRTMFNAIPDVHYCLLAAPAAVTPGSCQIALFDDLYTEWPLVLEHSLTHSYSFINITCQNARMYIIYGNINGLQKLKKFIGLCTLQAVCP